MTRREKELIEILKRASKEFTENNPVKKEIEEKLREIEEEEKEKEECYKIIRKLAREDYYLEINAPDPDDEDYNKKIEVIQRIGINGILIGKGNNFKEVKNILKKFYKERNYYPRY